MSGRLIYVLGDQLSHGLSSLADLSAEDVVLMTEVMEEASYVPHHKQKLVLIFSAMRHFAEELRDSGVTVDYVRLDSDGNSGDFTGELRRAIDRHRPDRIVVTEPGEWRVQVIIEGWRTDLPLPVEIRADDRFFCARDRFAALVAAGKTTRMETFYREMRRVTGYLMDDGKPVGGAWNYDKDNRKSLPKSAKPPHRRRFRPDAITQEVIALVADRFGDNFGDLEPFEWAVTRAEALRALTHFIDDALPSFGHYQDAMKTGEDFLYHGLISPYLNLGLLDPAEICDKAEAAWRAGDAPLNAVEGFIRQILGWREFTRGIYWTEGPDYGASNFLGAMRDLPWAYWSGETKMRCLSEAIATTRRNAYAHHIQRLMVTGNFALLIGVEPAQIEAWYLAVYADAFDWVELPNTHGMVMHADGGLLASKPYAASGSYIARMSDYCAHCPYDVKRKTGPEACPLNYLYWNFLIENEDKLGDNPRMKLIYAQLRKKPQDERAAIQRDARIFLGEEDGEDAPQPDQPRLADDW